jgi:hypothetical protein
VYNLGVQLILQSHPITAVRWPVLMYGVQEVPVESLRPVMLTNVFLDFPQSRQGIRGVERQVSRFIIH